MKFYSDSKNEEQLSLSYKEIEPFMEKFDKFQWYFAFDSNNIEDELYNKIPEDQRYETMI